MPPEWSWLDSSEGSARHVSAESHLTGGPPDSRPRRSQYAPDFHAARRELLQSAKRSARHSVSGLSKDVLHDLYI